MKKITWSLLLILVLSILLHADMLEFWSVEYDNAKYSASSVLKEKGKPDNYYGPDKAFDEDSGTAWCEGKKGDGIGESITITIDPVKIVGITVLNGYGKYKHLYMQNNRIKDFRITFYPSSGKEISFTGTFGKDLCGMELEGGKVTLEDFCHGAVEDKQYPNYAKCIKAKNNECILDDYEGGGQKILLAKPMIAKKIKLEILSVYKGQKFTDTCIGKIILIDHNDDEFGQYQE